MAGRALDQLEERLGRRFADRTLLERALTHSSFAEGRRRKGDNERLEFLGDRVLGLLVARRLYQSLREAEEGALAPRLNAIVRRETCALAARRAGLGEHLRLSRAEEAQGGRDKETILGDACEALIAALFLDGGLEAADMFVERFFGPELAAMDERPRDPKTQLQEWALGRGLAPPSYEVAARSGPDHRPSFVVEARVDGLAPASGEGGSKQAAERAAAAALIVREGLDG